MLEAIADLNCDPATAEIHPIHSEGPHKDHELRQEGTFLRDILLRKYTLQQQRTEDSDEDSFAQVAMDLEQDEGPVEVQPTPTSPPLDGLFKHDARIQSWAKRYSLPNPLVIEGDPDLERLNSTQIRAIALMLSSRFSLVQGVRCYCLTGFPSLTSA